MQGMPYFINGFVFWVGQFSILEGPLLEKEINFVSRFFESF